MKLVSPHQVMTEIGRYMRPGGKPISRSTLERLVRLGAIHPIQSGPRGHRAFDADDVTRYIESTLGVLTESPEWESNPRPFHYECNEQVAA